MAQDHLASGIVVQVGDGPADKLDALTRETTSVIRARQGAAETSDKITGDHDFILLIVADPTRADDLALPDLQNRAAAALALDEDPTRARAILATIRKRLRTHGATISPRQLVITPDDLGHLGIESDGLRERLDILINGLIIDAERLRLTREGWE